MRRTVFAGVIVSVVLCTAVARADERGWGYLMDKLVADGVSRERALEVFQDPRLRPFTGLEFSLQRPREPRSLYRRLLRDRSIAAARRCRARYAEEFEAAQRAHGVPANVLAAILFVESGCGGNTGSFVIFGRLARLAMANAPENLQENLDRYAADGELTEPVAAQLRNRARELEDTFYPEVLAVFTVADRMHVGVFDIRGSSAGAFGYPQFLPTSYLEDGVDANGDGVVSLYDPADAVASCARYFVHHGWHAGISRAEQRRVIWRYNHSDAYVDTILTLAARIDGKAPTSTRVAKARKGKSSHKPVHRKHRRHAPVRQART